MKRKYKKSIWPQARERLFALLEQVHRGTVWLLEQCINLFDRSIGRLSWSLRFAVLCGLLGAACLCFGLFAENVLPTWAQLQDKHLNILEKTGFLPGFRAHAWLSIIGGTLVILAGFGAFLRNRISLLFLKIAAAVTVVIWTPILYYIFRGPSLLNHVDANMFSKYMRNELWLAGFTLWLPVAFLSGVFIVNLLRRSVTEFFTSEQTDKTFWGDRFLKNLRGGGEDPRFRSSTWWASFLHIFIILILPILLRGCGWEKPYTIPPGTGVEQVVVKIKRVKKKVEKEKIILTMNTDILFFKPDPDDSDIMKVTDDETERQYEAVGVEGKIGAGGGKKGGWPDGMPGRVRFIRLEYSGGDWDQDMGIGADYNMLLKFKEMTDFPIAHNTESRRASRLKFFPKGKAPPFVFITGMGGMNFSNHESKVLRNYCIKEGGMIFADNGGGSFDSGFRSAMRRVFPDKKWITISNDDPIFQYPYQFPNGAPPLWHHSGRQAVGLKHQGRWIAFYHQGDLNDAWKTGHSGIREGLANQSYKLGINVMYYSFTHYLDFHHQPR